MGNNSAHVRTLKSRHAIVTTSIAEPTPAIVEIAAGAREEGAFFYCIGDAKSPTDWSLNGCRFVSLEEQRSGNLALGKALPVDHYARKNIGYLLAIAEGADQIVETDDDNWPLEAFWKSGDSVVRGRQVERTGWVNAYSYFSTQPVWPRGFPLEFVLTSGVDALSGEMREIEANCPVQQGLANGDTDVDAVFRMTRGELIEFEWRTPIILNQGAWCPFNSQNTRWWRPAFEMMYLPSFCSFRLTDIWRSFVAQACLWANDWRLAFMPPSVRQHRNPHDLLQDFEAEVPGYLNNQRIAESLAALALSKGGAAIQVNMKRCYRRLVDMRLIGAEELDLLDLWFSDLASCRSGYAL